MRTGRLVSRNSGWPISAISRRARKMATATAAVLLLPLLAGVSTPASASSEACQVGTVCQAESATLSGGAVVGSGHNGFTGAGFVQGYAANANPVVGASTEFAIGGVASSGTYTVTVGYANNDSGGGSIAPRTLGVYVNGARTATMTFAPTASWDNWSTVQQQVQLPAGSDTIRLACAAGDSCMVNLDYLAVTQPGQPVPQPIYPCQLGADGKAVHGSYGDASLIGWAADKDGVTACEGGSFYVRDGKNATYGFGIYNYPDRLSWSNVDGYLPALATSFDNAGAKVTITNFGDEVSIGGNSYVAIYSRVSVHNPTDRAITLDPRPTPGLVPLHEAPNTVEPGRTVQHDYVVAADRFGNTYPWPSDAALVGAGSYDGAFHRMRAFWNGRLAPLARLNVPDKNLTDAYKAGYIYNQIIQDPNFAINTGENRYDKQYSHDVVGILASRFQLGDFTSANDEMMDLRNVVGNQPQYVDAVWMYSWPWAAYLAKTGDVATVRANFATEGPNGASQPSIKDTAHRIAADMTGPGGTMKMTNDIDSNGYWTIDNFQALTGLAAYRYLAQRVGDDAEAQWAAQRYDGLLSAVNAALSSTISTYKLNYLPCSIVQPNTANRCRNPADANWASPFRPGRWGWVGYLLGAPQHGPAVDLIDATYAYGFGRLAGQLPANDFGGYPGALYANGYNAAYGLGGLLSSNYRTQSIDSYEFMISNTQSGPYSWWESSNAPNPANPWTGNHPGSGNGSSPHAWGIASANESLLDSVLSQRVDGTLVVGRGVPTRWLGGGKEVSVDNFPGIDGRRLGVEISAAGDTITLTLTGHQPSGKILFQLPVFVNNIAHTSDGSADSATGTVTLPSNARSVTVTLTDKKEVS